MEWLLRAAALALACGIPVAHAQSIYKCVARGQPASYQSRPCGPDEITAFVRESGIDPEAIVQASAEPVRAVPRQPRQRVQRRPDRVARTPPDACAETRSRRDAWERDVGLPRTYDQLRYWNDTVARACR